MPVGQYQVQFAMNGVDVGYVNFEVVPAPQWKGDDAPSAAAPSQPAEGYVLNTDPQGRYTVELPGASFREPLPGTFVFSVALDQELDPLATITLSIVDAAAGSTLTKEQEVAGMRERLMKEAQDAGAALAEDSGLQTDGAMPVERLDFSYTSAGGKPVKDRKFIVCSGRNVFVLTFIAEEAVYEDVKPVFVHVFETFNPAS